MKKKKNLIDPQTKIFLKGKHEGETIESIDLEYLYYLRDSYTGLDEEDYIIIAEYIEEKES
jgi:hypothetical protein